jgi:hypothetical protein
MKARHREPLRINFASRKNGLARNGQAAENGRNVIKLTAAQRVCLQRTKRIDSGKKTAEITEM